MTPFALALPWLALLIFARFVARVPSELPAGDGDSLPSVSVIVPARDEAENIETCVGSLTRTEYPDFEIIVVDDRSDDRTAELARALPTGNARALTVVDGEELPEGWLGKPWACHQGAAVATGELLLFTDADTTHGPRLLARAVAGVREEDADLLTIVGRQLMETFWERLIQPQIFFMMLVRFPDFERIARNGRWRDAIANGQYMLFPREAYDSVGGHGAVKDEVVEDLAMAQVVKRAGRRLRIRSAETDFSTRMYRSFAELVEGWSKNIVIGGQLSLPAWLRIVAPPLALMGGLLTWVAPPVALVASVLFVWLESDVSSLGPRLVAHSFFAWSTSVVVFSVVLWSWFNRRMGAPAWLGVLYPLGAAAGSFIFLRSWLRGRNVEWKGRRYVVKPVSERP